MGNCLIALRVHTNGSTMKVVFRSQAWDLGLIPIRLTSHAFVLALARSCSRGLTRKIVALPTRPSSVLRVSVVDWVRLKIQKGAVVSGCSSELKKVGGAAAVAVQNIKMF